MKDNGIIYACGIAATMNVKTTTLKMDCEQSKNQSLIMETIHIPYYIATTDVL